MNKLATKELIKNVMHKHFQFDNENVVESSVTSEASLSAMNELHGHIIGEDKMVKKVKKLTKNDKVVLVLSQVSEIVDYAIEHEITDPSQMAKLEHMLKKYIN